MTSSSRGVDSFAHGPSSSSPSSANPTFSGPAGRTHPAASTRGGSAGLLAPSPFDDCTKLGFPMKRPRSHGEERSGPDEDLAGEKGRDWGRRDQEGDRHSPRRRFYPKIEVDREPLSRSLSRKRFDYEPDSIDRRKSDRYGNQGDRSAQSSSPRVSYSFGSSSRRDYPKGFRSERDKLRREESSSSSSWRRSSEDSKSAIPSNRSIRVQIDEPVKAISRSSSGVEHLTVPVESKKIEESKETSNSSDREEGELEPDPEEKPPEDLNTTARQENADQITKEVEVTEARTESDEREAGKEEYLPQEEKGEVLKTDPPPDEQVKDVLEEEPEKKMEVAEEEVEKEEMIDEVGEKSDHQEEEESPGNPNLVLEVKPEEDKQKISEEGLAATPSPLKFIVETSDLCKGKGLILDDPMEGPSTRGFDLFSLSRSEKGNDGIFIGKKTESSQVLEQQLDLSLSLPGVSSSQQRPSQNHRSHNRSRPSSFMSNSEGFTASASFSGSQRTIHNPSCSLSHASMDNFENSVSSRPLFKPVDQISKEPFFRRPEANGKHPHSLSSLLPNGRVEVKSEEVPRERNNTPPGIIDRILSKMISDPLESSNRMIHEMTDQSIANLLESISIMIADNSNKSKISHFREILRKRADLTLETMSRLHPSFLSILVSLKTGLPSFLQRGRKTLASSDLAQVFFNLKCKNTQCLSILPVDDCDCKVCSKNKGFCSACMCLICGNFDSALNTCGWVGCDVCLHWCHTDCALKHSHIKNGERGGERNEVQFICVACGHPSEMFGFVKEVFKTCAMSWRREILVRELEYIRRIFGCAQDPKGIRLHAVAAQQLLNLGKNKDHGDVVRQVLGFLADSESLGDSNTNTNSNINTNTNIITPFPPLDYQPKINTTETPKTLEVISIPQNPATSPPEDELDRVVKFKRAEAEMYQTRAEDAQREAEGLKRIAAAKLEKIEEEFSRRMGRLRLPEVEERRRHKLQQLHSLERAQREFLNLKMRMEADVRELLLKMDAAQRNFGR